MMRNRQMLLKELMAFDFTIGELALYLDTHPYDTSAMGEYNKAVNKAIMAKAHYQKLYGPITLDSFDENTTPWKWIDSPWPWEGLYMDDGRVEDVVL